jgi:myo-inositol-1-phosphate synthase
MKEKIGIYLIGAYGAVATCAIVGAKAIAAGLSDERGLVTSSELFRGLDLPPVKDFVFGGCDLRKTSVLEAANEYRQRNNLLPTELLKALAPELKKVNDNIGEGIALGAGATILKIARARQKQNSVLQEVEQFRARLAKFRKDNKLDQVIVVNLASTEPHLDVPPEYKSLKDFEKLMRANAAEKFVPSVLYAYAAFSEDCAFVNFTPSLASGIPALTEMAEKLRLPHSGKDGKTGETLMKTVLAPMFMARNFKVLAWEGYNMLGNRDGAVLDDPSNKRSKTADKDKALRSIIPDPDMHTRVSIEYVPSLDDWKTAWDFIHFEGFLGTKMVLQFIWQGNDSMLASPLALDLARLTAFARRKGEYGPLTHLACFYKNPMGVTEHRFDRQVQILEKYVEKHLAGKKNKQVKK